MPLPSPVTGGLRWIGRHPILTAVGGLFAVSVAITVAREDAAPARKPVHEDMTVPAQVSSSLVERYVSPYLKDPSSAQYRNVTYRLRKGLPTFCGEVNGRGGFGGYAGFQHFVSVGPLVDFERSGNRQAFRREWRQFCVLTDHTDAKAAANTTGAGRGA